VTGPTTTTRLEAIAARESELARSLHAQFRRRLSADDTRDAVADAIAVAHQSRDELDGLERDQLEAWVRTRAYRNAIDQIRAIDGYAAEKRKASVSVEDYAETLAGDDVWQGVDDDLSERFSDAAASRSLELALARLTPDERRLLRLRHYDGLDVKSIASLLDIHPKKYERLHTRAISKLRTIFIETTAGEHCEPVRALIARSRREALAPALSSEIAAHVEACEQCRAYEKRSLKLIATLPLPAPAFADRLWSRVHELVPGLGPHGETIAAGATGTAAVGGAGGTAAVGGAGGTAASGGLLAGVSAKAIALCGSAAVTATCVGAVALPVIRHKTDDKRPPAKVARETTPRPPPVAATAVSARAAAATASAARANALAKAKAKARAKAKRKRTTGAIGLESFGTPTSGGSSGTPPPPPPPPPPPSSRFSQEFSP
jgi:RNA polymerase sigma factor (sigma-70 family)